MLSLVLFTISVVLVLLISSSSKTSLGIFFSEILKEQFLGVYLHVLLMLYLFYYLKLAYKCSFTSKHYLELPVGGHVHKNC